MSASSTEDNVTRPKHFDPGFLALVTTLAPMTLPCFIKSILRSAALVDEDKPLTHSVVDDAEATSGGIQAAGAVVVSTATALAVLAAVLLPVVLAVVLAVVVAAAVAVPVAVVVAVVAG